MRTKPFRRNVDLETLLSQINSLLGPAEKELLALASVGNSRSHPLVFVMGPLRSGTTLLMQWLASTGLFAYPTNFLSRFYEAPGLGALIQLQLTDERYNFRDELAGLNKSVDFVSENGKTSGVLSPNEFWYFWRRFVPFTEVGWLPDEELNRVVDRDTMRAELAVLRSIFDKPFAMKAMIFNYNIRFLSECFPEALFIRMRRDRIANVSSILDARVRQFGDETVWYSFKIPEYEYLRKLPAVEQTVGQLLCIERALDVGMECLPPSRRLDICHEDFCRDPQRFYFELCKSLAIDAPDPYSGAGSYQLTRKVDEQRATEIRAAIDGFDYPKYS
jgi:Sulfotransferase family